VLVAIADGSPGIAKRALMDVGATRAAILYAMRDVTDAINAEGAGRAGKGAGASGGGTTASGNKRRSGSKSKSKSAEDEGPMLDSFGRDLTQLARQDQLEPIIGRDMEIGRLMQVLGRRSKNNPVLIGEAGVGKTAIIEGFAQRIASGDVPSMLKNKRIVELDLSAMVAGTTLRGQFEARVKKLVDEVVASSGEVILYIDEIHTLVGAGGSGGAANMLKPALARGEISLIGTTTPAEYRKHIESDKALERRFQEIFVEEPGIDESVAILRGIKSRYEIHHKVRIVDSAIVAAVSLAERYVTDRKLPDKAVDLIDEAASRIRMEADSQPMEMFDLKRRIFNLEVEREALKQDANQDRVNSVEGQIAELQQQLADFEARIEKETEARNRLSELKAEKEATEKLIEKAQQQGDLGRAAELKYSVIKGLEEDISRAESTLNELGSDSGSVSEEVGEQDVAEVVADWTGIPTTRMLESERQKLLAFEDRMGERVIGQPQAVTTIAAAVRRSRAGLQARNRPIGNFFFVGPTGVGKTEHAKALAHFLFDSEDAPIRIDMSADMEQSTDNTLIGAAYVYVEPAKPRSLPPPSTQSTSPVLPLVTAPPTPP